MKALITGAGGFVGTYLARELKEQGYDLVLTGRRAGNQIAAMDVMHKDSIENVLQRESPDVIFHLAGQSNVAQSWKIPDATYEINVVGTIHLMEAVRDVHPSSKLLLVGSSDQYGIFPSEQGGVPEDFPLNPTTPYGTSKCAQEQIARLFAKNYGLQLYFTRSFNHIGRGQRRGFVVPDLASGIAEVEAGKRKRLLVGNLSAHRDFSDVRDIVRAYRMIIEKGRPLEIYNVGSEKAYEIQEILNILLSFSPKDIAVETDPARLRKADIPLIKSNCQKLKAEIGWYPQYHIQDTLLDILNSFREEVSHEA